MTQLRLRDGHLTVATFVHSRVETCAVCMGDGCAACAGEGFVRVEKLWESEPTPNALMNEGELNILHSYLSNQNHPAQFVIRLFGVTPVETDSLASLSVEPGGNTGYVAPVINRDATAAGWPTFDFSGGDARAKTRTVTFRATGPNAYPQVTHAALATTSDNTGKLIDATPLTTSRQLQSGEVLDIVYQPSLS